MKARLFAIALAAAAPIACCLAAGVTTPEAGKYYRIRHVSGLYLTDARFNSRIADKVDDNSQIVQFVPVEGQEGVLSASKE